MDILKEAVHGTRDYKAFMNAVVSNTLQKYAGFIPDTMPETEVDSPSNRGVMISIGMDDNANHREINIIQEWCNGRAWVAGSAALWALSMHMDDNTNWWYEDVDVFCFTKQDADALIGNLQFEHRTDEGRSIKLRDCKIDMNDEVTWYDTINMVLPDENDKWLYPTNVLNGFDFTCSQVAIVSPGVAYSLHPEHIEKRTLAYTGTTFSPASTVRRLFKYMRRGFTPDDSTINDMWSDGRLTAAMHLVAELQLFNRDTREKTIGEIYSAKPHDLYYGY